ncbi:PHP domain-containing protein [Actinotalea solisilvae]|uniref:PHP domain-containing protein n=1 Tax=Actinotalea solisilvae TaxID=2072922 RepID=UPI0018F1C426|nr:PHP domain-containing protein [Actinotalea solisilvae]
MRIDLHTHSVASDGTDAPGALVAAAARAGLDVVALTDHDTTRGWAEAEAAVPEHGVALVRGAEISCLAGHLSVHLLSYLHDPTHPGLLAEAERTRTARLDRARRMVDLIAEDLALTWDDVEAQTAPGTTVGRPHIADALAARGHVTDRSAAFATVLAAGSPYYVPHYAPDAARAVRLVREAGGVPVLAHPGALVRGRILTDAAIGRLVDAGLAGIEVDHRDHDDAQRRRLAGLAREAGLLVTGSSDYHGGGKPNLLGERTTSPDVLAAIEEQGRLAVVRP